MMDTETTTTEAEHREPRVRLTSPVKVDRTQDRTTLHNMGHEAGFLAAADDYVTGQVKLDLFSHAKTEEELTDAYALGFEVGYLRKLAEIAIY